MHAMSAVPPPTPPTYHPPATPPSHPLQGSAIDHSRVGMDGVQADPHAGDGAQQLIDLANAELAAINSALGIKN